MANLNGFFLKIQKASFEPLHMIPRPQRLELFRDAPHHVRLLHNRVQEFTTKISNGLYSTLLSDLNCKGAKIVKLFKPHRNHIIPELVPRKLSNRLRLLTNSSR